LESEENEGADHDAFQKTETGKRRKGKKRGCPGQEAEWRKKRFPSQTTLKGKPKKKNEDVCNEKKVEGENDGVKKFGQRA